MLGVQRGLGHPAISAHFRIQCQSKADVHRRLAAQCAQVVREISPPQKGHREDRVLAVTAISGSASFSRISRQHTGHQDHLGTTLVASGYCRAPSQSGVRMKSFVVCHIDAFGEAKASIERTTDTEDQK